MPAFPGAGLATLDAITPRNAVRLLRSLGYRASLKVVGDGYFSTVVDPRTKAQMGFNGYFPDCPSASDFFNNNFTCDSGSPKHPDDRNIAQFCDSGLNRKIEQALVEQVTNAQAARRLWERVDQQTVDQAPWVPLVNPKIVDVLSKRIRRGLGRRTGLRPLSDSRSGWAGALSANALSFAVAR